MVEFVGTMSFHVVVLHPPIMARSAEDGQREIGCPLVIDSDKGAFASRVVEFPCVLELEAGVVEDSVDGPAVQVGD